MMQMLYQLYLNEYRYLPYEIDFAVKEVRSLVDPAYELTDVKSKTWEITAVKDDIQLKRLAYFMKGTDITGKKEVYTTQYELESACREVMGQSEKRQSTRYSVHGLHEYKGKFNPQVVRGILNFLGVEYEANVLDPFCGSGTTLVECVHLGITAKGFDINPLAVFISNAKLKALKTPFEELKRISQNISSKVTILRDEASIRLLEDNNDRMEYLKSWFPTNYLNEIELLRLAIEEVADDNKGIFLTIASNILRDYSLQEPADLRIRKRKSPLPTTPFIEKFEEETKNFLQIIYATQKVLSARSHDCMAKNEDSKNYNLGSSLFDCAVTSPPYATALPYIDTQRLSLVWLGLCQPQEIINLESQLTGSREIRGINTKKQLMNDLLNNTHQISERVHNLCCDLQNALNSEDGFRRQAVPILLYRYFVDMQKMFSNVLLALKEGAPFALIVGHNHTTLGGQRFDIDTPELLVDIAKKVGWLHQESISLQTYQRYGLHAKNSTNKETLIILRKPKS